MFNQLFKGLFDSEFSVVISVTDFLLCIGVSLVLGLIMALAYMVRYARENLSGLSVREVAERLQKLIRDKGLGAVCGDRTIPAGVALPRTQEIFACFNRW